MISIGSRVAPVKSLTIRTSVFCCRAAVCLSRKIRDTLCPVVPEEVMVLTISSSRTLLSASVLNTDTGKKGISSNVSICATLLPRPCKILRYGSQAC
ncbi:hypothetical protein D3C81_2048040 [compost metagenome]